MRKRRDLTADVRSLAHLDRERLASSWSTSETKEVLLKEIEAMKNLDVDVSPRPRRLPRRTLVLVATLSTLALATVGWAVSTSILSGTAVGCHTQEGHVLVADAVTGDPVADCGLVWEQDTGVPPPPLAAYHNGSGGIEVIPAASEPPKDWKPVEDGFRSDPAIVALDSALNDVGSGLRSSCYTLADAERLVGEELERAGLADWTTTPKRGEATGSDTCTYFYLDAESQQVVLIPVEGLVLPDGSPAKVFADALAGAFANECLTVEEGAQRAHLVGEESGLTSQEMVVHEVPDASLECAEVGIRQGGRVEVSIRGPVAPS